MSEFTPADITRYKPARVLFCLAFLIAILGYLGDQAVRSPDVQFLLPAAHGLWIVHPNPPVPGTQEAVFVRRFQLPAATDSYPVRITAMRQGEVTLNGQQFPQLNAVNWKSPVEYNLGPALRPGENELRIQVVNRVSPPALLVEGPPEIGSDERWTVATSGPDEEIPAAVVFRDEPFLADQPNALRASPWFALWASVFALYCLFILYATMPRPWQAENDTGRDAASSAAPVAQRARWIRRGSTLCLLLFIIIAAIQLRNAWVYPHDRGFDPIQHAEYVKFLAERWQVPDVNQGWEMSQPPLYYALGAGLYSLMGGAGRERVAIKAVQLISPIAMLATVAVTWRLLILLVPIERARVLGFFVAALLPVGFYMSPQVTNEVFAALAIGIAMLLASRQILRRDGRWRSALLLGTACGVALLSKYTGLFVFESLLVLTGLRVLTGGRTAAGSSEQAVGWRRRFRHLAWAVVLVAMTLALCGWLYARNAKQFGNPFIGAWDKGTRYNIVQGPGYRTPGFYGHFGSVFWNDLGRSRDASFWDGMYGAMWADTHGVFLNRDDRRTALLSNLCVWLALLPSVAILLGFLQAVRQLLTREWDHPYFILVMTTVLTVTAVLTFALQHPFYSNLKAHFALSLTPCAGVFAALGLESMCQRLGRWRWLLYANFVLLGGLVLYVFWYR